MISISLLALYLLMIFHLFKVNSTNKIIKASPVVQTRSGQVEGEITFIREAYVERFLGIPFASPPVGSLRWRSPVQEKSWSGIRMAKKYSDACMQKSNAFTELPPVHISEDCLYLNVYKPHNALNSNVEYDKLPILLFFYGGSYDEGSSSFLVYDATERVAVQNGSEIVVTANYRLNVFGYLGADALRDNSVSGDKSTGNWGLRDQRAAMEWVRDNAEAFGGDPKRVTIFGESAGAGSVSCHIAAKKSGGLFHRAIMESGPIAASWISHSNFSQAEEVFYKIQSALNCSDTDCMRSKNATEVEDASRKLNHAVELSWAPLVDGVEFTEDPLTLVRRGEFNKVPVMLGTNRDEGSTFTDKSLTEAKYEKELIDSFGAKNASLILQHYPSSNYSSPFWAMSAVQGDAAMSCPARETARVLSQGGVDVYLYFFTRKLEVVKLFLESQKLGVFHGSELVFVFDKEIALFTPKEVELAGQFGSFWNSFAATGNPNSRHDVTIQWPRYNQTTDKNIRLDVDLTIDTRLKEEVCDFWTTIPVSRRTFHRESIVSNKWLKEFLQEKKKKQ